MKSSVTKALRKCLEGLPTSVQEQADKAYELWHEDPYHNSLQFKRVSQRQPITPLVSALTIECWDCWNQMTTFIGSGSGCMMSTMSC